MEERTLRNRRTGQILLREGIIDEAQLEQALAAQAASYRPLGKILEELGLISRQELKKILLKYKKQIPLGELLLKMGLISNQQLVEALKAQAYSTWRLGRILVEKGFIDRRKLVDAICVQLGIESADAVGCHIDPSLMEKVSVPFLRKRHILPLRYDKSKDHVAILMEDPTDNDLLADLEKVFRVRVEPVMLREGAIEYLLNGIFDVWQFSDCENKRRPRASVR